MVEPTHLKKNRQIGNLPQVGGKIKNIWNHHLAIPGDPFIAPPTNITGQSEQRPFRSSLARPPGTVKRILFEHNKWLGWAVGIETKPLPKLHLMMRWFLNYFGNNGNNSDYSTLSNQHPAPIWWLPIQLLDNFRGSGKRHTNWMVFFHLMHPETQGLEAASKNSNIFYHRPPCFHGLVSQVTGCVISMFTFQPCCRKLWHGTWKIHLIKRKIILQTSIL